MTPSEMIPSEATSSDMTPDDIISGLATAGPGRFPRAALIATVEQREAVTPLLLDELQRQIDARFAPALATDDYWLHLFAIYLLAYFREPTNPAPESASPDTPWTNWSTGPALRSRMRGYPRIPSSSRSSPECRYAQPRRWAATRLVRAAVAL